MRKFSASEDDLKFPEKWFTGVEIRGGSIWAGPAKMQCPMLMSTSRNIHKSLAQLKRLGALHVNQNEDVKAMESDSAE